VYFGGEAGKLGEATSVLDSEHCPSWRNLSWMLWWDVTLDHPPWGMVSVLYLWDEWIFGDQKGTMQTAEFTNTLSLVLLDFLLDDILKSYLWVTRSSTTNGLV
jgi:hypothetical protein